MASNSRQKSSSSDRSTSRKRVVIGARETVRVRYSKGQPEVESTPKERLQRPKERTAGNRLVEARRQDRERRQASIKRRRIAIGVGVVALVALAVFGLARLRHAETFAVRDVRVTGASRVPTETVLRLAAVPEGATLLDVDRSAIAERVASEPWVASAVVERDFPHTLVIRVRERVPAAWVRTSKHAAWLVASDGVWLKPQQKGDRFLVPAVIDIEGLKPVVGSPADSAEITNALSVLRQLTQPLRGIVKFVSAPSVEKTALVTKGGIQIFVGPATEMKKKNAVVLAILAQQKGKLVYINVRTPDRPTWRGLDKP